MTILRGNDYVARTLRQLGVEAVFYVMGGPMLDVLEGCRNEGVRLIDARHEQGATMMAHGSARVSHKAGVCVASAGPGVTNTVTGIATAFADGAPVVLLGGSTPSAQKDMGAFQDIDQLAMLRPLTKWSARVHDPARLGEYVRKALWVATTGTPGPVYLDLPGDVLYGAVDDIDNVPALPEIAAPVAAPGAQRWLLERLAAAERPVVIAGSGCMWSDAGPALRQLADRLCMPVFTTPMARALIGEDDDVAVPAARSHAFREADAIFLVGTRANYVVSYLRPPRFNPDAFVAQLDISETELGNTESLDLGLVGDARATLESLVAVADDAGLRRDDRWLEELRAIAAGKTARTVVGGEYIHPIELCRAVGDALARERDPVLVTDGHEILNYARQTLPVRAGMAHVNPGPFGTMGVGVPFGIGAQAVAGDRRVVCLMGDGSFGLNAMEVDTAVRHGLPITVVISNNGGWTALADAPGRDLGFTRYDEMARGLGADAAFVTDADELGPALAAALASDRPAVVNVITDPTARSGTLPFTKYADDVRSYL